MWRARTGDTKIAAHADVLSPNTCSKGPWGLERGLISVYPPDCGANVSAHSCRHSVQILPSGRGGVMSIRMNADFNAHEAKPPPYKLTRHDLAPKIVHFSLTSNKHSESAHQSDHFD